MKTQRKMAALSQMKAWLFQGVEVFIIPIKTLQAKPVLPLTTCRSPDSSSWFFWYIEKSGQVAIFKDSQIPIEWQMSNCDKAVVLVR